MIKNIFSNSEDIDLIRLGAVELNSTDPDSRFDTRSTRTVQHPGFRPGDTGFEHDLALVRIDPPAPVHMDRFVQVSRNKNYSCDFFPLLLLLPLRSLLLWLLL